MITHPQELSPSFGWAGSQQKCDRQARTAHVGSPETPHGPSSQDVPRRHR
jgi:hypothetical protein